MNKRLLIVVDMQNDFVNGSLANPMAEAIIPTIVEEMDASDCIIFTRDTHYENYLQTAEGKKLPIKHCIKQTKGWQFVEPLMNYIYSTTIPFYFVDKETFGLHSWDKYSNIISKYDEIELVGTCTDICVVSNALILKALYPEKKIVVKASACAGLTKEKHEAALETMRSCQIDVVE